MGSRTPREQTRLRGVACGRRWASANGPQACLLPFKHPGRPHVSATERRTEAELRFISGPEEATP